jgi:glycosyltransferase involved in cell wall biosynthesis
VTQDPNRLPRLVVLSRHYAEYCFRYANACANYAQVLLIIDSNNARSEWDIEALPRNPRLVVVQLDFRMRKSGLTSVLKALLMTLRFKPDAVHFQEVPDVVTPIMMALLRPFSRIVLTVHDPASHSGNDAALPRYVYTLRDFGRRRAHLIIVHGNYCATILVRESPLLASRIVATHHGVLMIPPRGFSDPTKRSILFFGRMELYKGLDVICDALRILDERGVAYEITIAGRGPAIDQLQSQLARMPRVTLVARFVPPAELSALLQHAQVIVLPYRDATQSGVLGAAFGNHRPVVASRVGGLPDVVKDGINGLLVEPGDPKMLADALQKIFEDDALLEQLRTGAVQSAENELKWDNIARDLLPQLTRLSRAAGPTFD